MRGSRLAVLMVVGLGMLGWSAREANAAIAVAPTGLDFGQVNVGAASTAQTVTITNDDNMNNVAVTLAANGACGGTVTFVGGPMVMVPMRVGSTDGSVTVDVIFTPTSRAALSGCAVTANWSGSPDPSFTVDGDGLASVLTITQLTVNFNPQRHNGGTPETRTLTIQNDGDLDVTAAQLTTALTNMTDFSVGVLSGTITGGGGTATLPITFNPAAVGNKTSTLTVGATNDAPSVNTSITLNGTGTQSVLTTVAAMTIGPTPAGTPATNTLNVQNTGTEPLNISTMAISGAGATTFSFTDHGCTGQTCNTPGAIAMSVTEPFVIRCSNATGGTFSATLTITSDDGVNVTDTVSLSCTTVPPTLTVAPTSVTFAGNTRVGTAATIQTITISNAAGAQALTYAAATSSMTEFPLSCMGGGVACLSGSIPAGSNAQIQVGFVPGAVGARSGMVTLTTNDPDATDATKVIPLAGTGAISSLSANMAMAFGTVDIAASGGLTQNLVLTNTGGMPLNISSMTISGDPTPNFTFAFGACTGGQSCGPLSAINAAPGPGNTLTITLRCDPSTIGGKTGTLNILSDDPASPRTVDLTCTGATPDIQIAGPPLADFGSQRINTVSATTRTFTISNPAGASTSSLTYNVTEASPHFSIACSAPGCSGTLAPGATAVTVTVSFRPTATGALTGTINVASNDVSTPSVNITVTGTGVEPLVALTAPTPTTPPTVGGSLTFPDTNVGATSATQTITIQNTGSMTLTVSSVTNTNAADFNLVGPATTTIAPSGSASWTVACDPNTQDLRTGTIQIANDSTNDTSVDVALSCNAVRGNIVVTSATPFAYTQPTNTIDFGTTFLNQSKMTTVTISNNGNRAVAISSITSAPAAQGFTIGAASAMTVSPGGSITLPITFMPTLNTQGAAVVTLATDWNTLAFNVTGDGVDSGLVIMKGSGAGCTNGTTTHDYGDVVWSSAPVAQGFCIKNIGQAAAPLTSVALMGANGNYTITGVPGTLPTLLTNQQLDVTVFADPNDTMLGMFTATLVATSTLPSPDNQKTVALSMRSTGPTIALNPGAAIDFGGVDVDLVGGRIIPLTITNMMVNGAAPLVISGISAPTGPFSLVSPPANATINSGESTTLMVRYDPTVERSGATTETSTFTLTTTGYYVGGVRQPVGQQITLTGYGIDQHVDVNGDGGNPVLAFGDVYRNPRADDPKARKTLQVCNTGEATLGVSMVTDPAAPFDVTGVQTFDLAGVAAPGGTPTCQDVTVEFRPADEAYQAYSGTLTVMNDDDGSAMVLVPLSGTSIPRPVTVTSGVTADAVLAVGVPVRLTELFPSGLTVQNTSTPSEGFTIDLTPSSAAAVVVGDAQRDLAAGETEVYDLTITATAVGELTFTADVHLDGDPFAHAKIPVTVTAVEVQARGGGGCSTGGGSRGSLALVAVVLAVALRRRRALALGAAALAVVTSAGGAAAQSNRDLELGTFSPAPATEGRMFAIESPQVGTPGAWALDLAVNHAVSPMKIETGVPMTGGDVISGRTALELGFAYAVIPKLELGLRVPLLRQAGADTGIAGLDFSDAGTAVGDVGIMARYALVDGKTKLGASAMITAPTAKADQFAGSGTVTGAGKLLVSAAAGKRLTLAANAGFLFRAAETDFGSMTQSHQVLFGAGVSVRAAEKLWVIGEGFGRYGLGGADDTHATSPIEATAGIRYRLGQSVALSLGGGTGLRAGIGAPKVRGFLMLSFSPKAKADAPLHVYVPPPPRDVADDDSDGVVNADDACKLDAEDGDGFEDADGCPDADNDKDGVLDGDDKCPDQPEDKDGVDDGDGCIDGDNDGDGVPDVGDKCPAEPEDKDGFEDDDGCDEPDNDKDGVPDVLDQCAMEPETINGNADEDGCPDKGDSLIMVMPDRIEVLEPVTFVGVTTKLGKNAPKALSQIGATMRADRKIKRLRITVHVHPRGGGDEQLSQKRADEIRAWLVNWGVEPERLDARGIGSKRPLVPKSSKGAEQINDRVEFIIFERQ